MEQLQVIKIGGNIIDNEKALADFVQKFATVPGKKILVHGGGKLATRLAEQAGIPQQLVDGRRITDAETLKIVTMVYAGYINKSIVAALQAHGCNAVGLCGADGNLIHAHKRESAAHDYGYVGDVDEVNEAELALLLAKHDVLVIAPITHDGHGQLLNTNADTIAQELAQALSHRYTIQLIYCFEKTGVLRDVADESTCIDCINQKIFKRLKQEGIISDGMLPKLDNAFRALDKGVSAVTIGHAAQLPLLISRQSGTTIVL
jgi:acetylglutamate kinase